MNKNNTLFRSAASIIIIAAIMLSIMSVPMLSYADTTPNLDVNLTLEATTLDFTVNGDVELTGTAGSTVLTGNSITVTNNTIGKITVDSIAFNEAKDSWTLVADDSEFSKMAWNQKKFSLKCGENDFAKKATMTVNEVVGYKSGTGTEGTSSEYSFSGHTGASTTAVGSSTTIANMVVTVSPTTTE